MSLAPPSHLNRFATGQRLWRITGHGRTARLQHLEVTSLVHHYAKVRLLQPAGTDEIDARPDRAPLVYTDQREAEIDLALWRHPLGGLADRIRGTNAKEALRCTDWGTRIGSSPAPNTIAAALRLLTRLGLAEKLPKPKHCPRWRLLAPPPDPHAGGTPDLPLA